MHNGAHTYTHTQHIFNNKKVPIFFDIKFKLLFPNHKCCAAHCGQQNIFIYIFLIPIVSCIHSIVFWWIEICIFLICCGAFAIYDVDD